MDVLLWDSWIGTDLEKSIVILDVLLYCPHHDRRDVKFEKII